MAVRVQVPPGVLKDVHCTSFFLRRVQMSKPPAIAIIGNDKCNKQYGVLKYSFPLFVCNKYYNLYQPMEMHLAQVNIARMLAPINSPEMSEFVANLNPINTLAENSDGFVWRLKDESDNATAIKVYDDDYIIVNMSVWKSIDALFHFVYKSQHIDYFIRRSEWFEKMPQMHMALWNIPVGHVPTIAEAVQRLDYLRKNGESDYAFTFRKRK